MQFLPVMRPFELTHSKMKAEVPKLSLYEPSLTAIAVPEMISIAT
jgi:hypothetical protein